MKKTERALQSPQSGQQNAQSTSTNGPALQSTSMRSEPLKLDSTCESEGNRGTFLAEVQEVLGVTELELVSKLIAQAAGAAQVGGVKEPNDWLYPLATLRAIGPKDELEALLAVQMVGTHSLGMECLRRASNADYGPAIDSQLARATKLLKLYSAQFEALVRHRGRGEQKMIVERVHIHRGGQAIVGTVNHESGSASRETAEEQG